MRQPDEPESLHAAASALAPPGTVSLCILKGTYTALCESCTLRSMVKKILDLAEKQIMREKIKKSRVGVNSSLLRIFIAKILAAPAVRMKGRNSYFHSPGGIRTENELDPGEQKASRAFSSE